MVKESLHEGLNGNILIIINKMDKVFTQGMIIKTVETKYGEIKKLSFKVDEFKGFLDTHDNNGWVNIDLLKNREWKEYSILNEWKKEEKEAPSSDISVEDLPF